MKKLKSPESSTQWKYTVWWGKHIVLSIYNGSHRHRFAIVYACAPYTCKFTLLGDLWLTVNAISAWRGVRDDICHLHEQIQSKQVFCFQSFFAIFSKDLFSDYFGPTCGKHAWLLYIFSETVRFRQPTVVDWIGWVKEQLRVTIIHPIPTSCYCHQNVIFQTIQRFASTYMLKSVLQYSRGLETILRSTLNHWTVINTIILSLCTIRD